MMNQEPDTSSAQCQEKEYRTNAAMMAQLNGTQAGVQNEHWASAENTFNGPGGSYQENGVPENSIGRVLWGQARQFLGQGQAGGGTGPKSFGTGPGSSMGTGQKFFGTGQAVLWDRARKPFGTGPGSSMGTGARQFLGTGPGSSENEPQFA